MTVKIVPSKTLWLYALNWMFGDSSSMILTRAIDGVTTVNPDGKLVAVLSITRSST